MNRDYSEHREHSDFPSFDNLALISVLTYHHQSIDEGEDVDVEGFLFSSCSIIATIRAVVC